jgi:hypothetical protein
MFHSFISGGDSARQNRRSGDYRRERAEFNPKAAGVAAQTQRTVTAWLIFYIIYIDKGQMVWDG